MGIGNGAPRPAVSFQRATKPQLALRVRPSAIPVRHRSGHRSPASAATRQARRSRVNPQAVSAARPVLQAFNGAESTDWTYPVLHVPHAAHPNDGSCHVGRPIRCEEQSETAHLGRLTGAVQWAVGHLLVPDLLRQNPGIAVPMRPGAIALTRMSWRHRSFAAAFVMPTIPMFRAALAAAW